ncbi:MAG: amino acid adenylation domain-containing protein, partial [Solirubrobacteraceae bacterium]
MTQLLQDYVTEQAAHGEHVGLVFGDQRVSYPELERASNRLARRLVQAGCVRGDRVCLLVEKSPPAIVAMLAALKAGCAYVPLDVSSPPRRVARILRAADPRVVLAAGPGYALYEALRASGTLPPKVAVGVLDRVPSERSSTGWLDLTDLEEESPDPLPRVGALGDLAHLLFTSGSTGAPKGVMVTHASVIAFVEWAVAHFGIRRGDRLSGHPPLHFDLSTFDVFAAFRAGAELHPVPVDVVLPRQLAEFIAARELSQWFSVPSTMVYMAKFGGLPEQGFPSLERVLWCGEVLPVPVLAQWMTRVPQARFTNLYGPTEATIASTHHTVADAPGEGVSAIPIGRACGGEEVFVVGETGGPARPGEIGEICIGGVGVSPGYWQDEPATRAAFGPDPRRGRESERVYRTGDLGRMDGAGVLHYVGRADTQIKSRGYRIELGEVEAAVSVLAEVAECAVVAVTAQDFSGTTICCAFTPSQGREADLVTLRSSLREALPAYMLPS